MDPSGAQRQPSSSIPRLSRLPLPRASATRGLRPSPSRERLQADPGLNVSRLRRPSLDHVALASKGSTESTPKPADNPAVVQSTKSRVPSQRPLQVQKISSRITSPKGAYVSAEEEGKVPQATDEEAPSEDMKTPPVKRKPRPSLSERTMETLAQIPPSPSSARRKSAFMPPPSPMGPPSRPASAMGGSRPTSAMSNSRPSTSHGDNGVTGMRSSSRPTSPNKQVPPVPRIPIGGLSKGPPKALPAPRVLNPKATVPRLSKPSVSLKESAVVKQGTDSSSKPQSRSNSPTKPMLSKSMALRSSKTRPSVSGAFRRASDEHRSAVQKVEPAEPTESTPTRDSKKKVPRSSLSLRETIAMAKKAARASNVGVDGPPLDADPFGHVPKDGNKGLLRKRVEGARTSGHLNLAAMGLRDIPDEVMNMYEFDPNASGEWYESVDLIKFIAADNELERIRDDAFPVPGSEENNGAKGSQFGGLEILDLHGNILGMLPVGLGLLLRLRVLNLSNNKLDVEAFSIICKIESLTELKIAKNAISGSLPEKIGALKDLEVLDIHGNSFEGLPESLGNLTSLRVLQVSENKISSIPFDTISKLPLTDIIAAKNDLKGTLIPESVQGFSKLRVLNVANNSLTALADRCLDFPNLQQLSIDYNRIASIPDITNWKNLLTITAEDCKFSDLPEGFVTLTNLRNADFTGNDLTKLDERIALMENLHNLQVASNPLRDRKFLTMATDELKRDLLGRLDPSLRPRSEDPALEDSTDGSPFGSSATSNTEGWPLKHGGVLDRSSTQTESLEESDLEATRSKGEIRSLVLHHNLVTIILPSLSILASTLTDLDLSHNKLLSTSEATTISLPYLKSLNLSSNSLTSTSLLSSISTPSLSHLDISCNRLTVLSRYRAQFPELLTVLASDNSISELDVEAVKGLRTLDVARNNIGFLPPKLGLLNETLRSLEVSGNTFRVPRYTVLEKGTEATLTWLRDKIPAGELEVEARASAEEEREEEREGEGETGGSEVDSID